MIHDSDSSDAVCSWFPGNSIADRSRLNSLVSSSEYLCRTKDCQHERQRKASAHKENSLPLHDHELRGIVAVCPLPAAMLVGAWQELIDDEVNVLEQLRNNQTKRGVFVFHGIRHNKNRIGTARQEQREGPEHGQPRPTYRLDTGK